MKRLLIAFLVVLSCCISVSAVVISDGTTVSVDSETYRTFATIVAPTESSTVTLPVYFLDYDSSHIAAYTESIDYNPHRINVIANSDTFEYNNYLQGTTSLANIGTPRYVAGATVEIPCVTIDSRRGHEPARGRLFTIDGALWANWPSLLTTELDPTGERNMLTVRDPVIGILANAQIWRYRRIWYNSYYYDCSDWDNVEGLHSSSQIANRFGDAAFPFCRSKYSIRQTNTMGQNSISGTGVDGVTPQLPFTERNLIFTNSNFISQSYGKSISTTYIAVTNAVTLKWQVRPYAYNSSCSVGSIESLSFRGCGGANASFNGTVSKALDIQNSNLTNLSFNMSNAANVTGSSANVSGSMNLTTLGNLTLSDSTINSASFNGVSGAANLQRVTGNSLNLNHTGSTLNMTTISTSGNTTISHQSGTPFKLKDFTVGSFNLNYKSTNVPDDVAVQPGSTSTKQVAELEKIRVSGGSTINGTNDSYLFMKQCTATGTMNFQNNQEVYIDGGTYKGSPAITGNNVTIKRGTLTDTGSTTSKFMVDPESDAQVATSNGQTITTVKLSNPPVIIDWADFPGQIADTLKDLHSTP